MSQSKKVLILLGSPRKKGNTATLAQKCADGAVAAGGEVEQIYLHGLSIKPCSHCNACKGKKSNHQCVIKDDMQTLYLKLQGADAIVLASPVYWFNYSAQLKLVVDRCYTDNFSEGYGMAGKRIGILLAYGDTDLHSSGGINAVRSFEDAFRFIKSEIIGIVHASAYNLGDILKHPKKLDAAFTLGQKLGRV
ncbi:MAG: flavodoxin family protein [Promethearchaeota archaeon]